MRVRIPPRAICPDCELVRLVRKNGGMGSHRYLSPNGYSYGQGCPGLNKIPEEYVMTTALSTEDLRKSDKIMLKDRLLRVWVVGMNA